MEPIISRLIKTLEDCVLGNNSFELLKSSWMGQCTREETAMRIQGSTAPKDKVNMHKLCRQDWDTGRQKEFNAGIRIGIVRNGDLPHLTLYLFI